MLPYRYDNNSNNYPFNILTMPYLSKAQRAFMHIHHPDITKRWDKENPKSAHSKTLPNHVKKKKSKETK